MILSERILVRDSVIILTKQRLDIKENKIESYKRDSVLYVKQLANQQTEISLMNSDINYYKQENRKTRLQLIGTKIVTGLIIVGELIVIFLSQ